jgi:Flp pilus assembly protein TadG
MRFGRDRKAAAAVEFALIAAPLIFMLCACIELGMVFLVDVTLDNATQAAARGIRTGTTTAANTSKAQFIAQICNNMGWLAASCPTSLTVDVQTYSTFSLVPLTDPVTNGKIDSTKIAYNIGTGSQIQEVRAYYDWPLFTPLLNGGLSTLSNGDALLSAKVIFRNEPF